MEDDSMLVNHALSGDKTAFDKLIHKYHVECLWITIGMTNDADLAKDLLQRAFIQAYFSLNDLRDRTLFKFWLVGIVKNLWKQFQRNQKNYISLENYTEYPHDQVEDPIPTKYKNYTLKKRESEC